MFTRLIAATLCLGAVLTARSRKRPTSRRAGNFPDPTKPASAEQIAAWRILVRVLQARYGIATERIYAHNWIDHKDARYCEGCGLATLARSTAVSAKP